MGMFTNLGKALSLLREMRGKSQARVAREAGIGKSQLSKYENGKELPKLDSLEKVLTALDVGQFEFFYMLFLVDEQTACLMRSDGGRSVAEQLGIPPLLRATSLPVRSTDEAFSKVFTDLLALYRTLYEHLAFGLLGAAGLEEPGAFPEGGGAGLEG
jgi:transcriptional regulator with XRE-family HTH domain